MIDSFYAVTWQERLSKNRWDQTVSQISDTKNAARTVDCWIGGRGVSVTTVTVGKVGDFPV